MTTFEDLLDPKVKEFLKVTPIKAGWWQNVYQIMPPTVLGLLQFELVEPPNEDWEWHNKSLMQLRYKERYLSREIAEEKIDDWMDHCPACMMFGLLGVLDWIDAVKFGGSE